MANEWRMAFGGHWVIPALARMASMRFRGVRRRPVGSLCSWSQRTAFSGMSVYRATRVFPALAGTRTRAFSRSMSKPVSLLSSAVRMPQ